MKTTVIYHSADFDGIFCREIARKFLPSAELIGWNFGDPPLPIPDGQIYVLDLPVDEPFGAKFVNGWWSVKGEQTQPLDRVDWSNWIWIDHHKSSIESHPKDIPGYRIDGVAACRLAWVWFTHDYGPNNPRCRPEDYDLPEKDHYLAREVSEPLAVRLAGEYDVWDKRDPDAELFQFGLRSREMSSHDWDALLSSPSKPTIREIEAMMDVGHPLDLRPDGTVDRSIGFVKGLLRDGGLLQAYQQRQDAGVMSRSFVLHWEGLKFLCLNTTRCNSLTFASRDAPETGHDALMGFYFNGRVWTFSLYHAKHRTDLDLSEIAKRWGGGGHRGACGFTHGNINEVFLNIPSPT